MGEAVVINAPRPLTNTERGILHYVSQHDGESCTKKEIALALGRNRKTIDRLVSRLRAEGLLVCEYMWDERGGQRANVYRLAAGEGRAEDVTPV